MLDEDLADHNVVTQKHVNFIYLDGVRAVVSTAFSTNQRSLFRWQHESALAILITWSIYERWLVLTALLTTARTLPYISREFVYNWVDRCFGVGRKSQEAAP